MALNLREFAPFADDVARVQVLSDLLCEEGDPRGEFVSVQLALERDPANEVLRAREANLLADHGARWLGSLQPLLTAGEGRVPSLAVTWRRGFLDSARIGQPLDDWASPECDLAEVVTALFNLESSMLLRELTIGAVDSNDWPASWQGCVDALAVASLPVTLKRLAMKRGFWDSSMSELGTLEPAYPSLHHLEELSLELGAFEFGRSMRLPKLKKIELITGGLTGANVSSIVNGDLASLEHLRLYLGDSNGRHGCTVVIEDLEPVFAARNLERVEHLALANSSLADDIAARLTTSRILPRLRTLDLSHGTLGGVGVRAMLANRATFAHLDQLDLSTSPIPEELFPQLEGLAKRVVLENMNDPTSRYVSLSE